MSVFCPVILNESIVIPFQPQFITDNALTITNVSPLFSKAPYKQLFDLLPFLFTCLTFNLDVSMVKIC